MEPHYSALKLLLLQNEGHNKFKDIDYNLLLLDTENNVTIACLLTVTQNLSSTAFKAN
jgi:flagellar assembly factor FliW